MGHRITLVIICSGIVTLNCSEAAKKLSLYSPVGYAYRKKQEQEKIAYKSIQEQLPLMLKQIDPSLDDDLWRAVRANDINTIKKLFAQNLIPNINARNHSGLTPLIYAASENYFDLVKLLIKEGAQLNMQSSAAGNTALTLAADYGYEDIVKLLIDAKANLNLQKHDGRTALMRAVANGHFNILKILTTAGADLDIRNDDGRDVLMTAALNNRENMVYFLVSAGADDTIENEQDHNKRAVDYASWWRRASIKQAIEDGKRERNRYQKYRQQIQKGLGAKLTTGQDIAKEIATYSFGLSPEDLPAREGQEGPLCIIM